MEYEQIKDFISGDRSQVASVLNWIFRFALDDAGDEDKMPLTRGEAKLLTAYIVGLWFYPLKRGA